MFELKQVNVEVVNKEVKGNSVFVCCSKSKIDNNHLKLLTICTVGQSEEDVCFVIKIEWKVTLLDKETQKDVIELLVENQMNAIVSLINSTNEMIE